MANTHHVNWSVGGTTANQGGEADESCSEWDDVGVGDGPGGDLGITNPVCVGAGDTIWTVVKSLSSESASNRARVSAR